MLAALERMLWAGARFAFDYWHSNARGRNGQYAFDEATGERIDILDSNFADGSGFFRLDLVAAASYLSTATEGALTDERLDGTNSQAVAQIDYDVMNDAEKTRLQKEVYEEKTAGDNKAKPFEEWVKTADQAAIERLGLDEASLVKAIAASTTQVLRLDQRLQVPAFLTLTEALVTDRLVCLSFLNL